MQWLLPGVALALGAYLAAVLGLAVAGRRGDARALATFLPDCVVLLRRLVGDARVPRWGRAVLVAVIAYLALPFDVVPDFIPVAGQADDAILLALALRAVLRAAGEPLLLEHWPGPERSLRVVRRVAFGAA